MFRAQIARNVFIGAAALTFSCSIALGQSACDQTAKSTCSGAPQNEGVAQVVSTGGECTGDKEFEICYETLVKAGMPLMKINVGEETTSCMIEASELAKKFDTEPVYFVGEKKFGDWQKAGIAYAKQLNGFLDELTTVAYSVGEDCTDCPMTAKKMSETSGEAVAYQVLGQKTGCEVTAGKMAEAGKLAAEGINLQYIVGEETTTCGETAKNLAKKCDESIVYQVAGQETPCNIQADIMLAMARIQAALNSQNEQTES